MITLRRERMRKKKVISISSLHFNKLAFDSVDTLKVGFDTKRVDNRWPSSDSVGGWSTNFARSCCKPNLIVAFTLSTSHRVR